MTTLRDVSPGTHATDRSIEEIAMALVQEFGYAVYGVRDLDAAVTFFRDICQLEVSERREGTVFLTADNKHAWLRLEQRAEPGLVRLGFRVTAPEALAEIRQRLEREGIEVSPGGTLREDRIDNSLRFRTPDDIEVELYEEQAILGASPAPYRGLERALHTVVGVADVAAARDFWKRVLDFKRSDQIEDLVVFLRCGNGYHHSLGLVKGQPGVMDHLCFLVDDIDTVAKFRNHARAKGLKSEEMVRHTASGSVSIYLEEPSTGLGIEFCAWHPQITDEDYNGRLLKAGPVTADRWAAGFPDATAGATAFGSGGGTKAGSLVSAES